MFQAGSARAADESPAATPTDQRSGGLDEIVVTARKREEPLQVTPVSISATSGATLQQALRLSLQPQSDLSPARPGAPIDYTADLTAPLLGLFGNDDSHPTPEQVNQHEEELKRLGKEYEFHRYDGAGHGFFYYHAPMYRPEAAMDGWAKIFTFFGTHLAG